MNEDLLKKKWKIEEEKAFKGWDFSYLKDRWQEEELPWNYRDIVLEHLKPSDQLLDMGTGGGEFLMGLNHPYNLTSITEAYPPNLKLCRKKLSPLGIEVREIISDSKIPYESDKFDVVINRHEAFDINEVARVLKNKGYFITQQVGGRNNNDLSRRIVDEIKADLSHNLENNIKFLKECGFEIILADEIFTRLKFYDIGALVYFAKIIEWEFPNFSVESCFDNLIDLKRELDQNGFISGTEHRFLIAARAKK